MRSATVKKLVLFVLAVILLPVFTACNQDNSQSQEYLIRVGEISATRNDFNRFWEVYAAPIYANGDVDLFFAKVGIEKAKAYHKPFFIIRLIKAKINLRSFFIEIGMQQTKQEAFDQFVITMLLQARAQDLGIVVSTEELDGEMRRVKDEYMDEVFDGFLVKAVISFDAWRDGLSRRLLMEKVMRADLYARGEITPEDVKRFGGLRSGVKATPEEVLERIYRAKAENDFQRWTTELQYKYPVDINYDQRLAVLNDTK